MTTTINKAFEKRATEVMAMVMDSVIGFKRDMKCGSGEERSLIFDLPRWDCDIDSEDMDYIFSLCPPIYKDNVSGEYEVIKDCVPIPLSEIPSAEVQTYYGGLTKIKRYLRKLGY